MKENQADLKAEFLKALKKAFPPLFVARFKIIGELQSEVLEGDDMRLRERDLKTCYLKKYQSADDGRGNSNESYSEQSIEVKMTVQSAGGQLAASIYGERLPYIKSCKYQGDLIKEGQNEKDGICLYVDKEKDPDFKIIAIQTYSTHVNVTLERI